MRIAVVLPSRGLIFSQTAEEILANLKGLPHVFYFSHGKPLPDCFEEPVGRALENKEVTHLWLVEDDMVLPPGVLQQLIDMDVAVATCDYPTNKNGRGAVFTIKKQVIFCGTGCLLVKREVFDELRKPYFRADIAWTIKNMGDHIKMAGSKRKDKTAYGLHDVNFCMSLYDLKIPIHNLGVPLAQRKLVALGKAGSNDGAHNIEIWKKIVKDELLKDIKQWPIQETGDLVAVVIDGKEIMTNKAHATKLLRKKLATKPPHRYISVDYSEVL